MAWRISSTLGSGSQRSCERFAGNETTLGLRRMVFMARFRATPNNQARGEWTLVSLAFDRMACRKVSCKRSRANCWSPTIRRRYPNMAGPCSWYNRSIGSMTYLSLNLPRTHYCGSTSMWRPRWQKFRKNPFPACLCCRYALGRLVLLRLRGQSLI